MKSVPAALFALAAASAVTAGPLQKRVDVTTTTTMTYWTTVTVDPTGPAAPTNTPQPPESPEPTPSPDPEAAPKPGQPSGGSGNAFIDAALAHHNAHRANHSAPALTWNADIAGYAAITAKTCVFKHDTQTGGGGYGQNLAMAGGSGFGPDTSIEQFIKRSTSDLWYNGELNLYPASNYGNSRPDTSNFHSWGHFSQVVWKNTQSVGCAVQYCKPGTLSGSSSLYAVCNYYPPGNVGGQYGANVLKPRGDKTVTENSKLT